MKKIFDFLIKVPAVVKKAAAIANSVHDGVQAFQATWNIHFPPKVDTTVDATVEIINKADEFLNGEKQ